jgi:hypothetical protein
LYIVSFRAWSVPAMSKGERPSRIGSSGLAREFPLERWARDARMLTLPDGTTQIQQLIIGRELVGLRAFA